MPTCVEVAGEHGGVVLTGEDGLSWGTGVVVVIVVGVREARFLAALMRTFTVDGIFAIIFLFTLI